MSGEAGRKYDALYSLIMDINEGRYRVYDQGGYRIWLNVTESRQMAKRAAGLYEPEKFAAIKADLSEGCTFLDIGGNKGDFALFAGTIVGPSGRSICFEPHPDNADWIGKSIALNDFMHVSLEQVALADEEGDAELNIGGKSGQHSLEPRRRDRGVVRVRTMRLDDYVKAEGIDRVNVMKIDVEGAEDRVITGAAKTLERDRPVIFLDVHNIGTSRLADMAANLQGLGYRFKALESGRGSNTLEPDLDYVLRADR